jgi:hypothetical protein
MAFRDVERTDIKNFAGKIDPDSLKVDLAAENEIHILNIAEYL